MPRSSIAYAPFVVLACVTGSSVVASAGGMATADQLSAIISGNSLQGSGAKDAYVEYYDPDGTIRGNGYTGKWKVEGDQGCMDYGSGFSCWTAYIDGAAAIWYKDGKLDAISMSIPGNIKGY